MLEPLRPGEIGDMHQPVDPLLDLDESAEIRHATDPALDHRADAVTLLYRAPRIGLELLESEGNPPLPRMQIEHNRLHLIAWLYDLGGMLHPPRPRHLAHVDQRLHS